MHTLNFSRRFCLVLFVCAFLAPGCGPKKPPQAPVSGKVTLDGQTVTSGQVSLLPVSDKDQAGTSGLSAGTIQSDGSYTIKTGGKDGAPLGKYKVTVTASMVPSADGKGPAASFDRKYSNQKETTLEIEVVANPAAGAYDLKLTK